MSAAENSERPEQNRDLRCQSGPSAKDSVIFSGRDSFKNYGADQQRLQILDLHFDRCVRVFMGDQSLNPTQSWNSLACSTAQNPM